MAEGGLEAKVEEFDGMINFIKGFQEFTRFADGLKTEATSFYDSRKDEAGVLTMSEDGAKALAKNLFAYATNHIATVYLKIKNGGKEPDQSAISALKSQKDPSTGKPLLEGVMRDQLGMDEESLYNNLKSAGQVTAQNIVSLYNPVLEQFFNTSSGKRAATLIKDNEDAGNALEYFRRLKAQNPKALKGVSIPGHFTSVDQVRSLGVQVARLLPPDYTANQASEYKKAA